MTKKDYELVASVFTNSIFGMKLNHRENMLLHHLAEAMADRFALQHTQFSKARFMQACKVKEPDF